jgi:chromosome segregation ATPase
MGRQSCCGTQSNIPDPIPEVPPTTALVAMLPAGVAGSHQHTDSLVQQHDTQVDAAAAMGHSEQLLRQKDTHVQDIQQAGEAVKAELAKHAADLAAHKQDAQAAVTELRELLEQKADIMTQMKAIEARLTSAAKELERHGLQPEPKPELEPEPEPESEQDGGRDEAARAEAARVEAAKKEKELTKSNI